MTAGTGGGESGWDGLLVQLWLARRRPGPLDRWGSLGGCRGSKQRRLMCRSGHHTEGGMAYAEDLAKTERGLVGRTTIQRDAVRATGRIDKRTARHEPHDCMTTRHRRLRQADIAGWIAADRERSTQGQSRPDASALPFEPKPCGDAFFDYPGSSQDRPPASAANSRCGLVERSTCEASLRVALAADNAGQPNIWHTLGNNPPVSSSRAFQTTTMPPRPSSASSVKRSVTRSPDSALPTSRSGRAVPPWLRHAARSGHQVYLDVDGTGSHLAPVHGDHGLARLQCWRSVCLSALFAAG
jgi:hypothetical protein